MQEWFENIDPGTWLPLVTHYGLRVIGAIVVLLLGRFVAGFLRKRTRRGLEKSGVDATLAQFAGRAVGILVLIATILAVLGMFDVQTASLVAVLGAVGLAVGLALQGTLSNFASGVMLVIFRPFVAGDVIEAAGVVGKVESIGLFTTQVDTADNRRIIVPNGAIFGDTIENKTFHDIRRVDVSVGTDYPADLAETRRVLESVPGRLEGILAEPAPVVFLDALGDSSINWQVRVWAPTAAYWDVRQAATKAVKDALDEAGIGIPFPQLDVHLDRIEADA